MDPAQQAWFSNQIFLPLQAALSKWVFLWTQYHGFWPIWTVRVIGLNHKSSDAMECKVSDLFFKRCWFGIWIRRISWSINASWKRCCSSRYGFKYLTFQMNLCGDHPGTSHQNTFWTIWNGSRENCNRYGYFVIIIKKKVIQTRFDLIQLTLSRPQKASQRPQKASHPKRSKSSKWDAFRGRAVHRNMLILRDSLPSRNIN